jgi:hypothetical protein
MGLVDVVTRYPWGIAVYCPRYIPRAWIVLGAEKLGNMSANRAYTYRFRTHWDQCRAGQPSLSPSYLSVGSAANIESSGAKSLHLYLLELELSLRTSVRISALYYG